MKRLLFMELRDSKLMLAAFVSIFAMVGVVMSLLLRHASEDLSFAIFGMVGGLLSTYIPLFALLMLHQPRGKNNRISTLASLPIDRVRVAISRYLAPASLQLAICVLVILSSLFGTHGAFEPLAMISSALNGAFVGLSLMALGLLILDFFPTTMVGAFLWLPIVILPREKSLRLLVDDQTSPSFLVPIVAVALVIIVAEVIVFSRRASLA